MLDPVCKNVLRKQNPFETVFKDIFKFDVQNAIIGSLLSEIESGKLTDESVKNSWIRHQIQRYRAESEA